MLSQTLCRSPGQDQELCSDCDPSSSEDDDETATTSQASTRLGTSIQARSIESSLVAQLPSVEYPTPFTARSTASNASGQLPEYHYPAPFIVRNTFIDEESELERIRRQRELHSAPAQFFGIASDDASPRVGSPVQTSVPDKMPPVQSRPSTIVAQAPTAYSVPANTTSQGFWVPTSQLPLQPLPSQMPTMMQAQQPLFMQEAPVLTSAAAAASTAPAPVALCLADALSPKVGTPECPTVGSAGHFQGTCKPCAFFHTKGCGNGINCPFCHLCDSNERKKRVQEKRQAQREERQRRRESGGTLR